MSRIPVLRYVQSDTAELWRMNRMVETCLKADAKRPHTNPIGRFDALVSIGTGEVPEGLNDDATGGVGCTPRSSRMICQL